MIPTRYLLVLGTFLLAVLLYVDRVCISTAKGPITTELKLSDTEFGWALSAFALGLVLFLATLCLNVVALYVMKTYREKYD